MTAQQPSARGVYAIAVASELTGVEVQTLRLYERKGLVTPHRTPGGTRRYSDADVAVVRRIAQLVVEGFNLAGAGRILELEVMNESLRMRIAELSQ